MIFFYGELQIFACNGKFSKEGMKRTFSRDQLKKIDNDPVKQWQRQSHCKTLKGPK
jgi:hypothetical protein